MAPVAKQARGSHDRIWISSFVYIIISPTSPLFVCSFPPPCISSLTFVVVFAAPSSWTISLVPYSIAVTVSRLVLVGRDAAVWERERRRVERIVRERRKGEVREPVGRLETIRGANIEGEQEMRRRVWWAPDQVTGSVEASRDRGRWEVSKGSSSEETAATA